MLMDPKIYRKKFDLYSKENKNTLKKKNCKQDNGVFCALEKLL